MVQLVMMLCALRRVAWLGPCLGLCLLLLAGCTRHPEAELVRGAVQQQLDAALGAGVLKIEQFRRAGSQPLAAAKAGEEEGRLVYFDAQLKLARDYDFTQWDALNVASLASLLGAGAKGLIGLKPGGNAAGDLIGVYGSAAFVNADGKGWALVPSAPPPVLAEVDSPAATVAAVRPRPREGPLPSAAELALERLASLLNPTDTASTLSAARREAIVTEELDLAYRGARARLTRSADTLVLASGPPGGAYAEMAQALSEHALHAGVHFEVLAGEGSVANVRALADDSAQFALVQNDVAAAAFAGSGRFGGAALPELRAVASLFPEAVQLVVRAGGPIRSLADLKGRRVDLGLERSGTRTNALAILAANGMPLDSLGASSASSLPDAAELLASGKIDAMFTTVHAPARALQVVAARTPLAWIDLLPTDALRASGLIPLKLPARTYARQNEPVQTLAATALMVTRDDVNAKAVQRMLSLLFDTADPRAIDSAVLSQVNRETAREGVPIPWAPGAEAFLSAARSAPPRDKPAR
jgi:TRAP transporter TAXI family solute receptor